MLRGVRGPILTVARPAQSDGASETVRRSVLSIKKAKDRQRWEEHLQRANAVLKKEYAETPHRAVPRRPLRPQARVPLARLHVCVCECAQTRAHACVCARTSVRVCLLCVCAGLLTRMLCVIVCACARVSVQLASQRDELRKHLAAFIDDPLGLYQHGSSVAEV